MAINMLSIGKVKEQPKFAVYIFGDHGLEDLNYLEKCIEDAGYLWKSTYTITLKRNGLRGVGAIIAGDSEPLKDICGTQLKNYRDSIYKEAYVLERDRDN